MMEQKKEPGKIITFYSFKGGVGRSMALANVASLMAKWGKKVLLVDFDLEAPGIEKYFAGEDFNFSRTRSQCPGIVDLLAGLYHENTLTWQQCIMSAKSAKHNMSCDILPAGMESPEYVSRLQSLNWDELFDRFDLTEWLENMRREWQSEYDFIFIDSRTGISDVGGICTIYLPDIITFLFTTNEASLDGCIDVVNRARASRNKLTYDRSKLIAIPIPSRSESDREYESSLKWKEAFSEKLGVFYKEWLPSKETVATAIDTLKIPYIAYWSFGDRLPVLEEGTQVSSIGHSFEKTALLILNNFEWNRVKTGLTTHDLNVAIESKAQIIKEETTIEISEKIKTERRNKNKRNLIIAAAVFVLFSAITALLYNPYQKQQLKNQIGQLPTLKAQFKDGSNIFKTKRLMLDASSFDVIKDKISYFSQVDTLVIQNCQVENLLFLKGQSQLRVIMMSDNEFLTSLSGIEQLQNLESLSVINSSALQYIDPVSRLSNLRTLRISGNRSLVNLSGIENISGLDVLEVTGNDTLRRIDEIKKFKNLGTLIISDKNFRNLSDYQNLYTLDSLEIYHDIENLAGIQKMSKLYSLAITFNSKLKDLTELQKLSNLHVLNLASNDNLESLKGISDLKNLKALKLVGNQKLKDINGIELIPGLEKIYIDEYYKVDISSLYKMQGLKTLTIPEIFKIDRYRLGKNNNHLEIRSTRNGN